MAQRVLIIPDKFKGTLTALAAAEAIAEGWRRIRPRDELEIIPMSDGGDGFGAVMGHLLQAAPQTAETVDAAHRPLPARWWWEPHGQTAIIESAQIIGLALLPPGQFHPFNLDTYGLGAVIRAAAARGARRCLMGIGGSATNDGGFGMARSLGWQFFNAKDHPLQTWTELPALTRLHRPKQRRWFQELLVAVDVQNRLLGQRGATRIYGPQKGLTPDDFPLAERCLRRLVRMASNSRLPEAAREPGAGAAGGLGYGLRCFLGARLEPGFSLFARFAQLKQRLRAVQLVITGEGAIDRSTFMGKGVGEIARWCRRLNIPCIGLAGSLGDLPKNQRYFTHLDGIVPHWAEITEAKTRPALWLSEMAAKVAKSMGNILITE